MKKRVILAFLVVAAVLLSSCTSLRCVVSGHKTHEHELPAVEPEPAGWAPFATIDGMKVYVKGDAGNPPVLLLHELPGMLPETVKFADSLVDKGYRVYMPLFFGRFGHKANAFEQMGACLGPSFNCLSRKTSRVAGKLATLRDRIATKDRHLRVIGMCLTGGMPLALVNERVEAVVLSQPSIPFPLFAFQRRSLGADLDAAANSDVRILALRFEKDCLVPPERFAELRERVPEERLFIHVVPTDDAKAHSVLTVEGQHDGQPVRDAIELVYDFLSGKSTDRARSPR